MTQPNIEKLLAAEREKTEKLTEKKRELEARIRESKARAEKLALIQDSNKYAELSEALAAEGIQYADVMTAIKEGGLRKMLSGDAAPAAGQRREETET